MNRLPSVFANDRRFTLAKLVLTGLIQIVCVMGVAWQSHKILQLLFKDQTDFPVVMLIVLVLFAVCSSVIRWYERFLAEKLGQNYVHEIRLLLFDALTKNKGVNQKRNGVHMVRFSNDLTAIRQWVSMGVAQFISLCLFFCGVIIAMSLLKITFALVLFVGFIFSAASIWLLGYGLKKSIRESRSNRGKLANCVNEIIHSIPQMYFFGRLQFERKRFVTQSQNLVSALIHRGFWLGSLTGLSEFCISMITIVVLILGVFSLNSGSLELPSLMAVMTISALIATPLRDFSKIFEYRKNYEVASTIIQRFLEESSKNSMGYTTKSNSLKNINVKGTIHFRQVKIRSMTIPDTQIDCGKRVAIVGQNGSGKTLLLKSIAGFVAPQSGVISVDETPTQSFDESARRRYIGIASQDLVLTSGSISKNIRYRNPGASKSEVNLAVKSADLQHWLGNLPKGLDTRLGGHGLDLSEGQAARVKLARAVLGKPPILILDGIERSLDQEGRSALYKILEEYPGTVIFVTEDTNMLEQANFIWRFTDKKVLIQRNRVWQAPVL